MTRARPPLKISETIQLPWSEFQLTFLRSSGPGGQNVNKVNSKVRLRWSVVDSSLDEKIKRRFLDRYVRRLTEQGELILTSQKYRDQPRNIDNCLIRLAAMVLDVAEPSVPRIKTRRTRSSVERRLEGKKIRSDRKQQRRKPPPSI